MKLVGIISTAVLALVLGIAAPVYAQEQRGDQDEAKPKQEDKAQPEKAKQEDKNAQQQEKNDKQDVKNTQQQEKNTKAEKNEQQAKGGQSARIPDDRYKANFGREHTFRVSQAEYGNRRFQYGGYWFGFAGAWPSNWLYTQNVFVVDIGGVYYLCNPTYPGVNIALSFSL